MLKLSEITILVKNYFEELDSQLRIISNKFEDKYVKLPSWALCNKKVSIFIIDSIKLLVVFAEPDYDIHESVISTLRFEEVRDFELHFRKFIEPANLIINSGSISIKIINDFGPNALQLKLDNSSIEKIGVFLSDVYVIEQNNPFAQPVIDLKFLLGLHYLDNIAKIYSLETAKKEAFGLWFDYTNAKEQHSSYVFNVQNIFNKLSAIINSKGFKERQIHRFINQNKEVLLPFSFKRCFFEHRLYLDGEYRDADFILERELAMPALLIELEAPWHKIFKENGEIYLPVTHAKHQIQEWIKFIDDNPVNSKKEMSFLKGYKQRLVIIGRGLEHIDKMKDTINTDTIIWSYHLLIKEAKKRINNEISDMAKSMNMDKYDLIR